MDRFGQADRFRDEEESRHLLRTSNDTAVASDEEAGVIVGKDGLVEVQEATVVTRHSTDGSEASENSAVIEFLSRPRRRRSWLARILMPLRRKRSLRTATSKKYDDAKRNRHRRRAHVSTRACGIILVLILSVFAIFGVIHIVNYIIGLGPALWDDTYDYWLPKWGQPGEPGEDVAHYPNDATRDVLPLPCHSHNDYWRRIPLYEALHYGCTGVEADVWLFDEELYVGHSTLSLTKNRTFRSLYVNPIVELLDKQNSRADFRTASLRNGVFEEDPRQTLVLLVDFKTNGRDIFPYVEEQISALREKNYLTHFNGERVVQGPVTVVGTGNTPFDLVKRNTTYRDIFFDAPLDRMWEPRANSRNAAYADEAPTPQTVAPSAGGQGQIGVSAYDDFDATNSHYASVNFRRSIGVLWRGEISPAQLERIRGQIRGAHARGLKVRYWNTPGWPVGVRNHVWRTLWKEGADMLNVDDLRGAARMDWRVKGRRGS